MADMQILRTGTKVGILFCLAATAGCSSLRLLDGELAGNDDEEILTVVQPYPGWETKAKETLDRIPTAGASKPKVETPSAASQAEVAPQTNATVTQEQPAAANPATASAAAARPPAATPHSPPAPIVGSGAAAPAAPGAPAGAKSPAPEETPVSLPPSPAETIAAHAEAGAALRPAAQRPVSLISHESAEPQTALPEKSQDGAKKEPPATERLAALFKQRTEFLAALKSELELRRKSASDDPELPRLEQELRLLYLAAEKPDEAVEEIAALDEVEREAFQHVLMGLATWMDADEAHRPTMRNAKILREIRDAAGRLSAASKLDVKNLAFCEKVESYGWYTEFPKSQFKAKQEVILYMEVENFTAEKTGDEAYETELQPSYQIFDSRGNLVDERQLPLDKEVCRNYRRDYFLAYKIYFPEGMEPGAYRLELTVEDIKGTRLSREESPSARRHPVEPKVEGDQKGSTYKGRKLGTGTVEFTIKG